MNISSEVIVIAGTVAGWLRLTMTLVLVAVMTVNLQLIRVFVFCIAMPYTRMAQRLTNLESV